MAKTYMERAWYTVRSDACMEEIEADTMDAAAVEFARGEGIKGVSDVASLLAAYRRLGGWVWIEPKDQPGLRQGSHIPEEMA